MLVTVREDVRRYHVGFEIDNSVRFEKGPNKGRPQTVTTCKIYLVPSVRGRRPQYVAGGTTVLGKKDTPDVVEGLKFALTRALKQARLGRYVNALIWADFQATHRRIDTVTCAEKFNNVAGFGLPKWAEKSAPSFTFWTDPNTFEPGRAWPGVAEQRNPAFSQGGPVHGYGGLHSFQRRAKMYMHRRHEYHDIARKDFGKSPTGKAVRVYTGGKTVNIRKVYGLGWGIIVAEDTGEVIWPRTKAVKMRELREVYNYSMWGRAREIEERLMAHSRTFAQAENRCRRVGVPVTIVNHAGSAKLLETVMGGEGAKRVRDIVKTADEYRRKRAWLYGLWPVADGRLTARMRAMSLNAHEGFKKLDAELLSRPGITKLNDEYIIDGDVFVPAFKEGETVTYMGSGAKIISLHGPLVTLRRFGNTYNDVFDHELEPRLHWLRRAGRAWKRRLSKSDADARGLFELIKGNYCPGCHGKTTFLRGPSAGSCSNVKCKYCGQQYWVDPGSCTARKASD